MADIDQQPHKDLNSSEAIKKMQDLAKASNACMFHTSVKSGELHVRPMATQDVDDAGTFWFISSTESNKNREIQADPAVIITYQNNSKYEYLAIHGTAQIHKDKALIEKYWTDFAKAWFEGKDDPRVSIISVKPNDGYYWDTKDGKLVSMLKAVFSAVTGSKNDDGGIEGNLEI